MILYIQYEGTLNKKQVSYNIIFCHVKTTMKKLKSFRFI